MINNYSLGELMADNQCNPTRKQKLYEFSMHFGKACGCHQKPERSLFIKGHQFFLCFRCTGIFFSEIILAPILYVFGLHFGFYTLLFALPMIIDGSLQYFKIIPSTNKRRLITGLLAGYGIGVSIIHTIVLLINYII